MFTSITSYCFYRFYMVAGFIKQAKSGIGPALVSRNNVPPENTYLLTAVVRAVSGTDGTCATACPLNAVLGYNTL
jgi:hypothetical protein